MENRQNIIDNRINRKKVDEEETIDLLELGRVLWKKAFALILALIIGAGAAAGITIFFITPQYEATSMIYVYSQNGDIASLIDLQIGDKVKTDFQIIAKTRPVILAAAKEINLDASYEKIVNKVTINSPTDSRIMEITVTDADPVLACNLSNALAHQLRVRIADIMNTDQPTTVQEAIVPVHPVSPSLVKNTALGGLGAFCLVAAVIVVAYLLDDTLKTEEDVEKYLSMNVIASVPLVSEANKRRKKSRKKKHRKTA